MLTHREKTAGLTEASHSTPPPAPRGAGRQAGRQQGAALSATRPGACQGQEPQRVTKDSEVCEPWPMTQIQPPVYSCKF